MEIEEAQKWVQKSQFENAYAISSQLYNVIEINYTIMLTLTIDATIYPQMNKNNNPKSSNQNIEHPPIHNKVIKITKRPHHTHHNPMKIQTDELFSSSTQPQPQAQSQFNDSVLQQSTTTKPSNQHIQQYHRQDCMKACSIISIILLVVMLVVSVGLNVYFALRGNDTPGVRVKVYQEEWYDACRDQTYEITIDNLSGKKVLLNVTHWPTCYYQNTPIRTRLLQVDHVKAQESLEPSQHEIASKVTTREPLPPSNQTIDPPRNQTKPPQNKIFNNEHKISVVAWVY